MGVVLGQNQCDSYNLLFVPRILRWFHFTNRSLPRPSLCSVWPGLELHLSVLQAKRPGDVIQGTSSRRPERVAEGSLGIHSDTERIRSNPHTNCLLSAGYTQSQINQTVKLVATAGKTWPRAQFQIQLNPQSRFGAGRNGRQRRRNSLSNFN